jgi:hypothetical protein
MKKMVVFVLLYSLCSLPGLVCGSAPDGCGYRFITSEEAGGPVFNWRDISVVGQYLPMLDDDNKGPFDLGFQIPFYGQMYESVFVCSNGWLSFTSSSHQYHHYRIPSRGDPDCFLAPLWTDLDPAKAGSVFVYQGPGEYVASWHDVPHRRGSGSFSFQAVILDDSSVIFQYLGMTDTLYLDSSSVGIENERGDIGLEYLFDGNPAEAIKDSLAILFFRPAHDVNPIIIHSPLETHFTAAPLVPAVSIANYGSSAESPTVSCTVRDSASLTVLYADTALVSSVDPADTSLVFFQEWSPGEGPCLAQFITDLSVNEDSSYDTLQRYFRVSSAGDMAHDDGGAESWYIVSGSPVSIMGVAVVFDPPYAPYRAVRGRILVSNTLPFEKVYLAPDDGTGVPDLESPYAVVEDVSSTSDTAWALAEFDVSIHTGNPVWLAAIWPRGAVGPLVGEDLTPPVDSFSYYTVYPPYWIQRTSGDWMMRIEIDDNVGVEEMAEKVGIRRGRLECAPNPFTREIEMRLEVDPARGGTSSIRISDASGRIVRSFAVDPRVNTVLRWDGTDSRGRQVPSGIYFASFSRVRPQKLILIR